jgi:hypothetical protein
MKTPTKTPAIRSKPQRSKLEVVDINVEDLIPDEDNPNEMDEAVFDQLIEEIREQGFDEPIQVRPHPTLKGKYQIGSGHHRTKAAIVLGMQSVPAVIKNWSDREQKVALTKRNVLRGNMNRAKLAKLYKELVKGRDAVQVQRELGFQDQKKFEAMIDEVSKNLTPKQKKRLAEAKESIKSMDDLSSVLNTIFKESGSELDKGYMVFSFGGKEHHYFQIDDATNNFLKQVKDHCDKNGIEYTKAVAHLLLSGDLNRLQSIAAPKPAAKATVKKKPSSK